jgi:arsenite methyltransferase
MERDAEKIKKFVQESYGKLAQEQEKAGACCPSGVPSRCCTPGGVKTYAEMLYTKEELEALPQSVADFALGCGNPIAIAELKPGEIVLDLGSGGGIDCLLAAQRVGATGRVIGLDMTPEMIRLARENARKMEAENVEFRLGEMEHMPVEGDSVDIIISNCVINLSPDKDSVLGEAFRVLKPGGRLSISDIVLLQDLPPDIRDSLEHWAGCVAGALKKDVYLDKIRAAGFIEVVAEEVEVPFLAETDKGQTRLGLRDKIASIRVKAFKPRLEAGE